MRKLLFLALLFSLSGVVRAENVYVIDVLWITMRSGQGDEYRVLRTLKSGSKLEKLQLSEDGEYMLVRDEKGQEGWAKAKYLQAEPTNAILLAQKETSLNKVSQENQSLKNKVTELREKLKETESERKRLDNAHSKLTKENEKIKKVAAKPMELNEENETLKQRNSTLETEHALMGQELAKYKSSANRDWFMAGGGVLFFGMIIGLIVPKIRWRRRSEWA